MLGPHTQTGQEENESSIQVHYIHNHTSVARHIVYIAGGKNLGPRVHE